ncbi:MAG TPA: ATP-grasp domain-containing protein [Silvibacterium sp.]|nr:ATP-grasp domain-containing protein [Silvibacterium sp.]
MSLSEAGCQVSAVCPSHNGLRNTSVVQRVFSYRGLRPLKSLTAAIEAVNPDIIVPCCDRSVGHLHELYEQSKLGGAGATALSSVIERSLGSPASYLAVSSRFDLLALAREEGVRVPDTTRLNEAEEFANWRAQARWPWVLKADGTWGGGGVRVVHSSHEFEPRLRELERIFGLGRALKRLLVNRDSFWLLPWLKNSRPTLVAQEYISGRPANCAVFCWRGRVLAGFAVEVVSSDGETGPANIVRVVESREMMFAAERIASRLELSGFFGLDFVAEHGSGAAYLIEMNPRATPLCHLRLGTGRDMAEALERQFTGGDPADTQPVTLKRMIAYFPEASDSQLLADCFYDIPNTEPELVKELLDPWPNRTLVFQLFHRFTRKPVSATKLVEPVLVPLHSAGDLGTPDPANLESEALKRAP